MKYRELTKSERKWNLMWDLWVHGNIPSPYAQLMEYDSEVNNGGHSQYFINIANCGDLKQEVEIVLSILPEPLNTNLKTGYDAFAAMEDICDDSCDELLEECDSLFYAQEAILLEVLQKLADTLTL